MRRAKCRACLAEFDFRYQHKDISDRERADKTYRRTAALAA
jgi:hypothetical protein